MTAVKTPNLPLPDSAPVVNKRWAVGNGENHTETWDGTPEEVTEKYETLKGEGEAGLGIAELTYQSNKGRATLVVRLSADGQNLSEHPSDVQVMEELYAVDVIKDIAEAPYFSITLPAGHPLFAAQDAAVKSLPLSDDEVAFVRYCVEQQLTEAEITAAAQAKGLASTFEWANWTIGMKELRWHLMHGVTQYYETGFVLRRSSYGVRKSRILASFTGINAVADGAASRQSQPTFSSEMNDLIEALPDGEWLYRPPQAEHLGKGRWRIAEEYQWAEKWSIVYGGTWNLP